MTRVVGLGAGGHAKVVIDILRRQGDWEIVGLLAPDERVWQTTVLGVPVLGRDDLLWELHDRGIRHAFVGVGSIGTSNVRSLLFTKAKKLGFEMVRAIHPAACIAAEVELGAGTTVMAGGIIGAGAQLGQNVIVNSGAIVEHDCRIGDHVHVAPAACLSGGVCVGELSHIGAGATVIQGIRIGARSVVAAGAVVIADVPDNVTVAGVPARLLKRGLDAGGNQR